MKITIEIEESRFQTFLEFIKTLDYVSVEELSPSIPQWQINETEIRLKQIQEGKMKTRSWEEAQDELFEG
ncbi:MAG: addiction module protein [Bacteroidota bacterium]|uniref:Putative addiction module component n=1 Tax=Algoriphagus faecimaris TaxID=686796 RepID=A0A1G6Q4F3_9BACT|nr:addiction module protein [Algoriphagus faecimaris]SDC87223.1 Putative addiction module component [Algoriphagus faecimaris]